MIIAHDDLNVVELIIHRSVAPGQRQLPACHGMNTTLMGGQVEPRRDLIETNVFDVENIDL